MQFTQEVLLLILPFVLFSLVARAEDYVKSVKVTNGLDQGISVTAVFNKEALTGVNRLTSPFTVMAIEKNKDYVFEGKMDDTDKTKVLPLRKLEVVFTKAPIAAPLNIDVHDKYAKGKVDMIHLKIKSETEHEKIDNALQAFVSFPLVFALLLGGLFY